MGVIFGWRGWVGRPASRWHSYMRGESSRLMSKKWRRSRRWFMGPPWGRSRVRDEMGESSQPSWLLPWSPWQPPLVSLYCSWAFWAKNILKTFEQGEVDAFSLMHKPQALWDFGQTDQSVRYLGARLKDSPTKGAELWAIWDLEAFVVLGIAVTIAIVILESQPFL